ncbi:hypothetical protein QYE76_009116 [Lolium multiflorum]|uniref:Uncharacterized protein n=1 Tax=Lolium multiflorum TaxID=4521 RepID=A0AAD8X397_LOLMU|nr:hypothetical protein QYE76_009116 [Lolium multiflorum]
MTKEARRRGQEEPWWAHTLGRRGPGPGRAATWCGGPTTPFASFSSRNPSSRKPKPGYLASYSRLCGAENTREKELSGGQESAGKSLREEIDAIVTVIELDIISITIIIISTVITAISSAAPRHRRSNLVLLSILSALALQKPSCAPCLLLPPPHRDFPSSPPPPTPAGMDPQEVHAANIRRAIEAGEESTHDFSVWSEDDKSSTDGESDLRFLADGESEEEER